MKSNSHIKRICVDAVTMVLVSGLSLFLLMYVGFGEAQRTFQQFHIEKLSAQARVVQSALESYLRPGLPLKQYVGFTTRADPILQSDGSIAALTVFDNLGAVVFSSGDRSIPLLEPIAGTTSESQSSDDVRESSDLVQVVLPLRNRFEQVGSLAITMPRTVVTDRVEDSFQPLVFIASGLSVGFALLVAIFGPRFAGRKAPWLQLIFAATFLSMAVVVIGTLISLYSEGVQAKTKALADSLGQRLSDIVAFNLNLSGIHGLDKTFGDYLELNPDISAAGLTIDGEVKIHTDETLIGKKWVSEQDNYDYVVDLTPPGSAREIRVAVALPAAVVYRQIARSVKNFTALFVASAFLAGVFLQLAASMQRFHLSKEHQDADAAKLQGDEAALNLVKPVFFVAVLVEHLTYAFLPQFIHEVVASSGLSAGYVSAPFMAYYLFFALSLVPAGHFAQQYSPRPLMYWGLLFAAAGLFMLTLPLDLTLAVVARSLSGIGQGMLFIGVQSYILAVASPSKRTQGAAIIVFGFQGGMISGMAIGSLLVLYIGASGVFTLGALVGVALAIYAVSIVPKTVSKEADSTRFSETIGQLARNTGEALRSFKFMKTMILIGVPAKAVLTGVVIFALPLLLSDRGYAQEDIGQIIMVYAAGVVVASTYISRLVDRMGKSHMVLFWGSLISAIGLIMIGLMGSGLLAIGESAAAIETTVLITGVVVVGIAHGFINAPVVTHIAESKLSQKIGESSATATYRFLERLGHIAGPIIIGQLFLFAGQNAFVLTWVGGAIAVFGFLFLIGSEKPQVTTNAPEHRINRVRQEIL